MSDDLNRRDESKLNEFSTFESAWNEPSEEYQIAVSNSPISSKVSGKKVVGLSISGDVMVNRTSVNGLLSPSGMTLASATSLTPTSLEINNSYEVISQKTENDSASTVTKSSYKGLEVEEITESRSISNTDDNRKPSLRRLESEDGSVELFHDPVVINSVKISVANPTQLTNSVGSLGSLKSDVSSSDDDEDALKDAEDFKLGLSNSMGSKKFTNFSLVAEGTECDETTVEKSSSFHINEQCNIEGQIDGAFSLPEVNPHPSFELLQQLKSSSSKEVILAAITNTNNEVSNSYDEYDFDFESPYHSQSASAKNQSYFKSNPLAISNIGNDSNRPLSAKSSKNGIIIMSARTPCDVINEEKEGFDDTSVDSTTNQMIALDTNVASIDLSNQSNNDEPLSNNKSFVKNETDSTSENFHVSPLDLDEKQKLSQVNEKTSFSELSDLKPTTAESDECERYDEEFDDEQLPDQKDLSSNNDMMVSNPYNMNANISNSLDCEDSDKSGLIVNSDVVVNGASDDSMIEGYEDRVDVDQPVLNPLRNLQDVVDGEQGADQYENEKYDDDYEEEFEGDRNVSETKSESPRISGLFDELAEAMASEATTVIIDAETGISETDRNASQIDQASIERQDTVDTNVTNIDHEYINDIDRMEDAETGISDTDMNVSQIDQVSVERQDTVDANVMNIDNEHVHDIDRLEEGMKPLSIPYHHETMNKIVNSTTSISNTIRSEMISVENEVKSEPSDEMNESPSTKYPSHERKFENLNIDDMNASFTSRGSSLLSPGSGTLPFNISGNQPTHYKRLSNRHEKSASFHNTPKHQSSSTKSDEETKRFQWEMNAILAVNGFVDMQLQSWKDQQKNIKNLKVVSATTTPVITPGSRRHVQIPQRVLGTPKTEYSYIKGKISSPSSSNSSVTGPIWNKFSPLMNPFNRNRGNSNVSLKSLSKETSNTENEMKILENVANNNQNHVTSVPGQLNHHDSLSTAGYSTDWSDAVQSQIPGPILLTSQPNELNSAMNEASDINNYEKPPNESDNDDGSIESSNTSSTESNSIDIDHATSEPSRQNEEPIILIPIAPPVKLSTTMPMRIYATIEEDDKVQANLVNKQTNGFREREIESRLNQSVPKKRVLLSKEQRELNWNSCTIIDHSLRHKTRLSKDNKDIPSPSHHNNSVVTYHGSYYSNGAHIGSKQTIQAEHKKPIQLEDIPTDAFASPDQLKRALKGLSSNLDDVLDAAIGSDDDDEDFDKNRNLNQKNQSPLKEQIKTNHKSPLSTSKSKQLNNIRQNSLANTQQDQSGCDESKSPSTIHLPQPSIISASSSHYYQPSVMKSQSIHQSNINRDLSHHNDILLNDSINQTTREEEIIRAYVGDYRQSGYISSHPPKLKKPISLSKDHRSKSIQRYDPKSILLPTQSQSLSNILPKILTPVPIHQCDSDDMNQLSSPICTDSSVIEMKSPIDRSMNQSTSTMLPSIYSHKTPKKLPTFPRHVNKHNERKKHSNNQSSIEDYYEKHVDRSMIQRIPTSTLSHMIDDLFSKSNQRIAQRAYDLLLSE